MIPQDDIAKHLIRIATSPTRTGPHTTEDVALCSLLRRAGNRIQDLQREPGALDDDGKPFPPVDRTRSGIGDELTSVLTVLRLQLSAGGGAPALAAIIGRAINLLARIENPAECAKPADNPAQDNAARMIVAYLLDGQEGAAFPTGGSLQWLLTHYSEQFPRAARADDLAQAQARIDRFK